jgi:hypothetical protein
MDYKSSACKSTKAARKQLPMQYTFRLGGQSLLLALNRDTERLKNV